jgi:membrane fusion protein, heavy metal efflux system
MIRFRQESSCLLSPQSLARGMLALAIISLPLSAMAADEVKLSPEQATSLGVRVAHPVASPTDKTLPYPAQIVIPTPQLWVVSTPVAGMVTSLSVARGDRVNAGQSLVIMQSPSFVSQQREYLHAVRRRRLLPNS